MKTLLLTAAILTAMALLFSTASQAQRRGGGFGGGRSFSAPRSSFSAPRSSFGGSGFSSPRSVYTPPRPYGYGYGGPRFFFFGWPGIGFGVGIFSLIFLLLIVMILVAAARSAQNRRTMYRMEGPNEAFGHPEGWGEAAPAAPAAGGLFGTKYGILNVGLHMANGDRYAKRLDRIMAESDFSTPAGRSRALHRIAKALDPTEIVQGFVRIVGRPAPMETAGARAEELARAQMKYIGIDPDRINVAGEGGVSVQVDPTDDGIDEKASACVVSIVVSAPMNEWKTAGLDRVNDPVAALGTLATIPGRSFDAVYIFFSPQPGDALDPSTAQGMYLDLDAESKRG
jgi:uncharacterized membrane protein